MRMELYAEWQKYFDGKQNTYYERPCCPVCSDLYEPTPIVYKNNKYICLNCQKEVMLDAKQKRWIDKMRRVKKTVGKCIVCGAYRMVIHKRRNPITNKWEVSSGKCTNCNTKMIV